jgi:hypothetical protein
MHELTARLPPLAYASVGRSGDFGRRDVADDGDAQTWTFACGVGWLNGLGLCVGPFFGTGVGLTYPGGVLAGAGGGVGVVVGIGTGIGLVWGSGRGVVKGIGVTPPMQPPFANGLPRPADLPSPRELARRATDNIEELRESLRTRVGRRSDRLSPRLAIVMADRTADGIVRMRPPASHSRLSARAHKPSSQLADPCWPTTSAHSSRQLTTPRPGA